MPLYRVVRTQIAYILAEDAEEAKEAFGDVDDDDVIEEEDPAVMHIKSEKDVPKDEEDTEVYLAMECQIEVGATVDDILHLKRLL